MAFLKPLVVYDKITSLYKVVPTAATVKTEAGLLGVLQSESIEPTGPTVPRNKTRDIFWSPTLFQRSIAEALVRRSIAMMYRRALIPTPIQHQVPEHTLHQG